jgi:hypothetical protein
LGRIARATNFFGTLGEFMDLKILKYVSGSASLGIDAVGPFLKQERTS